MSNAKSMNIVEIARKAHEINKRWCELNGDVTQVPWAKAPEWQKASAVRGVTHVINNPHGTPEMSHNSWLTEKVADGWVYGKVKDVKLKTHPCIMPYHELPAMEKVKDQLFQAVVRAHL